MPQLAPPPPYTQCNPSSGGLADCTSGHISARASVEEAGFDSKASVVWRNFPVNIGTTIITLFSDLSISFAVAAGTLGGYFSASAEVELLLFDPSITLRANDRQLLYQQIAPVIWADGPICTVPKSLTCSFPLGRTTTSIEFWWAGVAVFATAGGGGILGWADATVFTTVNDLRSEFYF